MGGLKIPDETSTPVALERGRCGRAGKPARAAARLWFVIVFLRDYSAGAGDGSTNVSGVVLAGAAALPSQQPLLQAVQLEQPLLMPQPHSIIGPQSMTAPQLGSM